MGTAVPITSRQFICKVDCFQMIASISWITGMGGMGVIAHSFVRSRLPPKPLLQRTSVGVLRGEKWGQGVWMLWAEQLEAMSPAPCIAPLDTHRGVAGKEILTACGVVSIWEIPGWPAGLDASTLLVLPSEWPWAGQAAQVQASGHWVPASAPGTHVPVPRGTWCKRRVSTWWQLSRKLKSYSLPVKSFTGLCWCRPCKIILCHLI